MTRIPHRRARCGVCNQVCEQTSTVMVVGGRRVPAWQCLECGMHYEDDKAGGCAHCHSSMVTHLLVRDPSGAELPATDCVDCEQICLSARVATDHERVESERNQALEAKCALLSASLKQEEARALRAELKLRDIYEGNKPNPIDMAEALAEEAEKTLESHLVEFADALGLINHFEGQAGYERADVPTMLRRIEDMEHANDVRIEVEAKTRELVREVREWWATSEPPVSCDLNAILAKYESGGGG